MSVSLLWHNQNQKLTLLRKKTHYMNGVMIKLKTWEKMTKLPKCLNKMANVIQVIKAPLAWTWTEPLHLQQVISSHDRRYFWCCMWQRVGMHCFGNYLYFFFLRLVWDMLFYGRKNSNSVGLDYPKRKIALVTFRFLWNCEFILSFCAVC